VLGHQRRHYWVVVKLVINVIATVVLLLYMQSLSYLAGVAKVTAPSNGDLGKLRNPTGSERSEHVRECALALLLGAS
jgi:hypothetical protein